MARKLKKTPLQEEFDAYVKDNIVPEVYKLYAQPAIKNKALSQDEKINFKDVMAELLYKDESLIEKALQTYKGMLEQDIATRFSPEQQNELVLSIPRLVKNYGIALSGLRTRKKREYQVCRTFDIKLYPKRMSKEQFDRKRLEAKWCYNDILEHGVDDYDLIKMEVEVLNPKTKKRYPRQYLYLTQRERQGILDQIKGSIRSLSTSKSKGRKVGALKFKSQIDTIPLDQKDITHIIRNDGKHVHIAGVDKDIYARGMEQLSGWDINVAKLMWIADELHLKVTAYKEKEKVNETGHKYRQEGRSVAFDLGVHDQMTFSDGTTVNLLFENSRAWRCADRKMSAQKKGSGGRSKTKAKRRKAAIKDSRKKDDAANKVCALISKNAICITQDDDISAWKRKDSFAHGSKKIQHGILGRVMSKLKTYDNVYMLSQWTPTTSICPKCHAKTKHGLDEQGNIQCKACDFTYPRNAGAAWSMEYAVVNEFADNLPTWFSPIEVQDNIEKTLALARKRSAWDENMTHSIDDPRVLDAILGHVDDKSHYKEDMSGRKEPRAKDGWISRRKTRGKKDKWARFSKTYDCYVRIGEVPQHADVPIDKVSSRDTEEGRSRHNKSRSRARADRRAYRWTVLKRKRREREHGRCERRDAIRLEKEKSEIRREDNQCTLGTRGINAGGDGQKPPRECRGAASSKRPEAATSGPPK